MVSPSSAKKRLDRYAPVHGRPVERIERVPDVRRQRGAGQRLDGQALLFDPRPLLADGLAPAALEGAKEVVEAAIAAVVPVILHALALEHAGPAELVPLLLAAEGDVQGRHAELLGGADQGMGERGPRGRAGARPDQEARPRHRGERHRHLELGIIRAAGALVGIRPAPVEHVLAVGVALQIHRCAADQLAAALGDQVQRQPTGALARRAAVLEGGQEDMAEEGLVGPDAGVPGARIDLADSLNQLDLEGLGRGGRGLRRAQRCPRPRPQHCAAGSRNRLQSVHAAPLRPWPRPSGPMRR